MCASPMRPLGGSGQTGHQDVRVARAQRSAVGEAALQCLPRRPVKHEVNGAPREAHSLAGRGEVVEGEETQFGGGRCVEECGQPDERLVRVHLAGPVPAVVERALLVQSERGTPENLFSSPGSE